MRIKQSGHVEHKSSTVPNNFHRITFNTDKVKYNCNDNLLNY